MILQEILKGVEVVSVLGNASADIRSVCFDSRKTAPGAMFIAVRGTLSDGHAYIAQAIGNGAVAVVCEQVPENPDPSVVFVTVADSSVTLGRIASNFYGDPSAKLKLVGVTGTNGKTTTATLLYDMFRKLGYKAGLISTVIYRIDGEEEEATHTTPDSIRLNELLSRMVDAGCGYCFMEVSSHSVVQHRVEGLTFAGGIFTNITHDHLDYHVTFANYIAAKKQFFDNLPKGAFALVNADDRNGKVMVQNTAAQVKTYSLRSFADYRCRIMETHFDGMELNLDGTEVWVGFLGRFNAYNLTSVYAATLLLGQDREEVLRVLSGLAPVSGRFEYVRSLGGVTAIVDYAHTPDALENVINTINEIREPGKKLYIVIGCGGERDAAKRPVMARLAATGGDMAILTSDNPRNEDPEEILHQMKQGLEPGARYLSISSRREAIRAAAMMAEVGDIILIAGKGHETYQDIAGIKYPFDDKEEIAAAFKELGK